MSNKKINGLDLWLEQSETRVADFIDELFEDFPVNINFHNPQYTDPERKSLTADVYIYIKWPDEVTSKRLGYKGVLSIHKQTEIVEQIDIAEGIAYAMEEINKFIQENELRDNKGNLLTIPEYRHTLHMENKVFPLKEDGKTSTSHSSTSTP